MRVSEQISAFLDMLRETPSMCRAAQEDETRSDWESQDILLCFENCGYYASDAEIVRVGGGTQPGAQAQETGKRCQERLASGGGMGS